VNGHDRAERLRAVTAAVVAGLALVGCGGSGAPGAGSGSDSATATGAVTAGGAGGGTATTSTARATAPRTARPVRGVHGPPVGARQAVHTDGADLTVTILRVLRLQATGSPVLPGTRQVGVMLRVADQQGATYDSTASGDVSLVLSEGRGEPLDVRRGPCETQDVDFESIVSAGSVRTGCVAFSLPRRARVLGVRFSPHSRARGRLTWRTS
jgi:hypothetical protein